MVEDFKDHFLLPVSGTQMTHKSRRSDWFYSLNIQEVYPLKDTTKTGHTYYKNSSFGKLKLIK